MYESVLRAVYEVLWAVTTCETTIEADAIGFGMYEPTGVTITNVLVDKRATVVEGPKVASK